MNNINFEQYNMLFYEEKVELYKIVKSLGIDSDYCFFKSVNFKINKRFILNFFKKCAKYFSDKVNNYQLIILCMSICQFSYVNTLKRDFFIYSNLFLGFNKHYDSF